ncbi:MAG: DUF1858 domain-containing protein [Eubacteriales bacterium]
MDIKNDTKLRDILNEYPYLKQEITKISPKFKMLNTPIGKVMASKVSVKDMSEKSGIEIELLIEKISVLINEHDEG